MRNLTIQGRCFLAAGAAAVICGMQIGERDFVRIGLVTMLVPLVAWLLLRRTDREVWVHRSVSAPQVEAGGTAEVEIAVGNAGRRTGLLVLEEEIPEALGPRPRFVVDPLPAGSQTVLQYPIRTEQRGRYPIGPLRVRLADPVGMVDLHQDLTSSATILVTPRTEPLPRIALTGRLAGAGDERTRDLLGSGSPDVTIREYRLGDDLRRIHWPTSARVDQLMVRREEQQWQTRCTLLIDNRRIAHRGYGPAGSMETAVRATASIARHLVAQDFEVRLVSAAGVGSAHGWHHGARGADLPVHLERLALMGLSRQEQLAGDWFDESQQGGMLVAVLGHLAHHDRAWLAGLAATGLSANAVVLDIAQWDRTGHGEPPATSWLHGHGWKAATLGRDEPLTAAWMGLAR